MDPQPPMTPPEKGPEALSFEEFSVYIPENGPCYMNFSLFFVDSWTGETYRKRECYKKFAAENPTLATLLFEKVKHRDMSKGFDEAIRPFTKDFYEAYKIMCKYVASPSDPFA